MSKNNVRIAIRDSTDSHNVAFFDNQAGIKYKSANLQRFLAGSASILTLKYNSKDIDSVRSGCKLAFRYKARDYWLNVLSYEKKGYEVEITAYSLGLELNNETRGEHKPDNAMSIAEYVAYYDYEHALTIGVNEVSDKRIKLEWTGTDTVLARLFSVANSFDAELDFSVELNDDYSLKRQVLNIYKKGNLGTNKTSSPVRVGKELKVINYSDNIKELRTAVRATGKDGLTIDGLNKKIYDDNNQLLYYSSGDTVYAPQSRDRFPSVGKGSNDNWIVEDLGSTEYETKEALWAYLYGEIQKKSLPEITYEVEGAIEAGIGDTQTLIDDVHFEPALYVQARVSELEDDMLTGKVTKSTFINFERKYSQIADSLLKQVEALAEDAAPYIVRLSTDNGYNFKNGQGTSTITAKLEKYSKIVNADWKWLINNSIVSKTSSVTINASQVVGTLNVVAVASVDGNEVAREYITFTNSDDGVGIKSIERYYTTNDQTEGVTTGGENWSTKPTTVTADKKYMWSYDVITYTNDTSLVTEPTVIGARGDDGLDADTTGITEALDKAKKELATVAKDLNTAKQELQTQASQLTAQASAQSELTKRVSTVEETANGTKTTVSELSKTVGSNTKNISSVTARTKTVEDDLTSTKTTLSQIKTTADSASSKTATLETGLDGVKADLTATTATADTTKTNLANYQASNDKAVANLQSNLQTANGSISSLQTKVEAVPGQITSAVSAVEGNIPSGEMNLVEYGRPADGYSPYKNAEYSTHSFYYNSAYKMYIIKNTATSEKMLGMNRFKVERNTDYTLYFKGFNNGTLTHMDVWFLKRVNGSTKDFDSAQILISGRKLSVSKAEDVSVTFNTGNYDEGYIRFDNNGSTTANTEAQLFFGDVSVKKGKSNNGWGPSQAELASSQDLKTAQSEIKQTTDSIKASVSALDSSTVKTASLNLDNNGFVTKVGKTVNGNTLATMIAQDENDVQIIAKKMKVSGDMIVNGAITAEKLNINSLSALNAELGDVTSGSITNSFVDATRSGTIKIDNSITIDTKDTSATVANKANQHIKMNSSGFALTAENSSNKPAYSMQIMPESINFNKLDYDTTRGGTSGWSLTHNGYYSMLQVDMVWQNVRLNNTSNLMFAISANYIRIGNLVTISVNRQIKNITTVAENELANETIPKGFRPITQAHLILAGNVGSSVDTTCIVHLNPDGVIQFTNNKAGDRVWSGTVTYTCVEPMPYAKDLNNGSTI